MLREEHEGTLRVPAGPSGAFGFRDLVERAAQMDRGGLSDLGRRPGDRPVERVVDLEDPRDRGATSRGAGGSGSAVGLP